MLMAPSPALTPGTGCGFARKVPSTSWTVPRFRNEERLAPFIYLESILVVTGDGKVRDCGIFTVRLSPGKG